MDGQPHGRSAGDGHLARRDIPVEAELLDDDEKAAVWPRLLAVWPTYDTYAERSGRNLRVFRLAGGHGHPDLKAAITGAKRSIASAVPSRSGRLTIAVRTPASASARNRPTWSVTVPAWTYVA